MTEAVAQDVNAAPDRQKATDQQDYLRRLESIRDISRNLRNLPVVGPGLTDVELYDEEGMPK